MKFIVAFPFVVVAAIALSATLPIGILTWAFAALFAGLAVITAWLAPRAANPSGEMALAVAFGLMAASNAMRLAFGPGPAEDVLLGGGFGVFLGRFVALRLWADQ